MELNEIIRKLRRKKEWSQENLAVEMGLHHTTIIRWEQEASSVSYKDLHRMAQIFEMSVPELLNYNEDESGNIVLEPLSPYGSNKAKGVKVIIELDGSEKILKHWFNKLERLNAAI